MNDYRDVLAKIEYYKTRVHAEFAKRGLYPSADEVENRISKIDHYLSILRHAPAIPGEKIDVDVLNRQIEELYQDLKILYRINYDLAVVKTAELADYADAHLDELQQLAETYERKNNLETQNTALGKTIFYKTHGFSVIRKTGAAEIPLGPVSAQSGSSLSCLFSADNVPASSVAFRFCRGDDTEEVSEWSYGGQALQVPGSAGINRYEISLPEEANLTGGFILSQAKLAPSAASVYRVLAGKDRLLITKDGAAALLAPLKSGEASYLLPAGAAISFYLYDASYADIYCSESLVSQNFSGQTVLMPQRRQKISLKVGDKQTGLRVITNGSIYAQLETGTVSGGSLWYPRSSLARDFLVEESKPGEPVSYDNVIAVIHDPPDDFDIRIIAVKEGAL